MRLLDYCIYTLHIGLQLGGRREHTVVMSSCTWENRSSTLALVWPALVTTNSWAGVKCSWRPRAPAEEDVRACIAL